jgi:ribulose-bisphosphate carboxylase large chain
MTQKFASRTAAARATGWAMQERFRATYFIETPLPVEQAAAMLAGEQSSGTFTAIPGETGELKARFAARVEGVNLLDAVDAPSLPGGKPGARYQQAELTLSWPLENVGTNLPALVSTVAGNLYELTQFTALKLLTLDLPAAFCAAFRGPAHGVDGTRRATGTARGPLVGTIIKPSVGLSPVQTAALVARLCEAGIDFIKDDELMANPPHSPFDVRAEAIMRVINDHAQRTGKHVLYAFNISDDYDAMQGHYDKVLSLGGTAAMLSVNAVGLAAAMKICARGQLIIHGHRNGWGMLNRSAALGISFPAYGKIWRLAGVDQMHVNGIANKFWESDDAVVRSIETCREPLHGLPPVMPVLSSGQWGGQAFETWRRTRTTDVLYLAGGGIMAHPGGIAGGVSAIRHAWECAERGLTLEQAAAAHPELRQAVEKFAPPAASQG